MSIQPTIHDVPAFVNPDRMPVLENLSVLRQEWEFAANNDSLLDVSASVGLILLDITTKLGLTADERSFVLGSRLNREITVVLASESAQ